ncbi:MAG: hypothetical protein AB1486_34810, partial [Planctomycetota bacterium]
MAPQTDQAWSRNRVGYRHRDRNRIRDGGPPYLNHVTYHGLLAPNAPDRAAIVPHTPPRPQRSCPLDGQDP